MRLEGARPVSLRLDFNPTWISQKRRRGSWLTIAPAAHEFRARTYERKEINAGIDAREGYVKILQPPAPPVPPRSAQSREWSDPFR